MGWPGYDFLMQAEAGYLHLTGEPGTAPARMGLSIIDFMTGITLALALVSTLLSLRRGGIGRDIDVSLFDVALHQLSYPATWFFNEGHGTERQARSAHPSATPVQLYKTKDGWIFLMCMTEKFWQQLVLAIGSPGFAQEPRFSSLPERRRHREELTALLDEVLSQHTTDHWLGKFQGLLPAAPVNDLANALNNPFLRRVGMVRETPHPTRPDFMTLANPIKLDGQRLPGRVCSPIGADTDSVLREAGLSEPELCALRVAGAV
jgi:crotonobetainyl-CoA:carnitine CoA-transferase CaiB-like acyl-CoA transferase